jgi:putative membrane protein
MRKFATGATVSLLAISGLGVGAGGAAAAAKPAKQDATWMKSNAQTDLAEISAGKLVRMRSTNSATMKLAKVTETQHKMVLAKLQRLASKLDVTLPTSPSQKQLRQASMLKAKTGLTFDRYYDTIQIAGHQQSISLTKREIHNGQNPTVVSFAKHYLPFAQMHLKMAEKLKSTLSHTP